MPLLDLISRLSLLVAAQRTELARQREQIEGWTVFANGSLARERRSEAEASALARLLIDPERLIEEG